MAASGRSVRTRGLAAPKLEPRQVSVSLISLIREERYNELAAKAKGLGLVKAEAANLQRHFTGKTLDGLYTMIGEEEKRASAPIR